MPGYLTHLTVLIETEKWLGEIVQKFGALSTPGRLEKEMLRLARKARSYLRYEAGSSEPVPPPAAPASIENKIGDQISRYSYSGSLGPDIPAASYIFANNQKWVWQTMHRGSPMRAWVDAGTTKFVLQFIDSVNRQNPSPDAKGPMMSYVIGHLSSIATHVIIHPFILHANWETGRDHHEMEIALDAKLAILYFKRSNLFRGQSWEYYYLDKGDFETQIKRLLETYLESFKSTYGSSEPLETMCGLPALSELEPKFPEISSVPGLRQALTPYSGIDRIEHNFKQLESDTPLKIFLKDYECTSAKLDVDFLIDGYRNTVNWAIDEGYDESPIWLRLIWLGILAGGAALTCYTVWDTTENFGPSAKFIFGDGGMFGLDPAEFERIKTEKIAAWQSGGFFGNEWMWFDSLDSAYSVAGFMVLPFTLLLTGPLIGIFRQGTKTYPERIVFTVMKSVVIGGMLFLLKQGIPEVMANPAARWFNRIATALLDVADVLGIKSGDRVKGKEADRFSLEMYKLQLIVAAGYFLSCILTFSVKSAMPGTGGAAKEVGFNGRDFGLIHIIPALTFPALMFCDSVQLFDSYWIKNLIGLKWPSNDTRIMDTFLTAAQDGALQNGSAGNVSVRLFKQKEIVDEAGKKRYPEAAASTPFVEREKQDEQARKEKSASFVSIGLKNLLDRAKYFSGMLAMAAVRYDTAAVDQKEKAARVFKNWNLDFRAEEEWNELMRSQEPKGLLEVMENWWTQTGTVDTRLLEEFFGVGVPTHSGQIEDRSVVPRFPGSDSNRIFLKAGTNFKIVDAGGNSVYTGQIQADGKFEATLPPGNNYELTIENYEGLKI
jgi:hypothetical protein